VGRIFYPTEIIAVLRPPSWTRACCLRGLARLGRRQTVSARRSKSCLSAGIPALSPWDHFSCAAFDEKRLEIIGSAFTLAEAVQSFSASQSGGVLAYWTGAGTNEPQVVWF